MYRRIMCVYMGLRARAVKITLGSAFCREFLHCKPVLSRHNNILHQSFCWNSACGRGFTTAHLCCSLSTMSVGGVIFPLEQKSRDPQSVVYTGVYNTEGMTHTKSGDRQAVQISLQFPEVGSFEVVWQVKYYNYNKRDHCQGGNSFNSIEYECKPNETRSLMWVNKELFV
ncbi:CB1 cannabinoid receptor-interacting protein 1b isoform X1 [Salvelinus fontinalis]|uniref:CB1 cannabinoid receptor-interacting protein 1b isoform X1 n=1 Tax=Salvelinus fontinalis TaxID=8038 RepID=UPI0024868CFF|nr:CB1 cannabinoid receptor-interacting protein 1b isoform X1 [Salvelinus fontinalis]